MTRIVTLNRSEWFNFIVAASNDSARTSIFNSILFGEDFIYTTDGRRIHGIKTNHGLDSNKKLRVSIPDIKVKDFPAKAEISLQIDSDKNQVAFYIYKPRYNKVFTSEITNDGYPADSFNQIMYLKNPAKAEFINQEFKKRENVPSLDLTKVKHEANGIHFLVVMSNKCLGMGVCCQDKFQTIRSSFNSDVKTCILARVEENVYTPPEDLKFVGVFNAEYFSHAINFIGNGQINIEFDRPQKNEEEIFGPAIMKHWAIDRDRFVVLMPIRVKSKNIIDPR